MSKNMDSSELSQHLQNAINNASNYLSSLANGTPEQKKKAQLLGYWISDYVSFLKKEDTFDPRNLIRYKRGNIVKVHLGYRIGSEEGGLHYAVVVDVENARSSPIVTVVPLTSVKSSTDINNLHASNLYLGNEVYSRLQEKVTRLQEDYRLQIKEIGVELADVLKRFPETDSPEDQTLTEEINASIDCLQKKMEDTRKKIKNLEKCSSELSRMKSGSIALVTQITCVSKIRIFDPLYPSDVFANVRLSDELLNSLDNKIKYLFTKTGAK